MAEQDWNFAVEAMKTAAPLPEIYGAKDELERISFGAIAPWIYSVPPANSGMPDELSNSRSHPCVAEQTFSLARPLDRLLLHRSKRENLFSSLHIGQEEQPVIALAISAKAFQNTRIG